MIHTKKVHLNTASYPADMTRVRRDAIYLIGAGTMIALITIVSLLFLAPFAFIGVTSLKDVEQLADPQRPVLPLSPKTFEYEGQTLILYEVPIGDEIRELALIKTGRSGSQFIDPANPEAAPIDVPVRAITLKKAMQLDLHFDTYEGAIRMMDLPHALANTLLVTVISTIGAVSSAALVAYGFSRFRVPGINILFFIMLSTIILPPQVTLIPSFVVFSKIGWYPSLLPLIVPHFFGNAYNVFLLRQYFMVIPAEMDEAAKVDGANPLTTFIYIILPQARAALITVTLFHFLYAWSEFYLASIFTASRPELATMSVALQRFFQQYSSQPHQLMAAAVLTMLPPLVIFFLAQRYFMQGIVITGVDK